MSTPTNSPNWNSSAPQSAWWTASADALGGAGTVVYATTGYVFNQNLQRSLASRAPNASGITVDANWGPNTNNALKSWAQSKGVSASYLAKIDENATKGAGAPVTPESLYVAIFAAYFPSRTWLEFTTGVRIGNNAAGLVPPPWRATPPAPARAELAQTYLWNSTDPQPQSNTARGLTPSPGTTDPGPAPGGGGSTGGGGKPPTGGQGGAGGKDTQGTAGQPQGVVGGGAGGAGGAGGQGGASAAPNVVAFGLTGAQLALLGFVGVVAVVIATREDEAPARGTHASRTTHTTRTTRALPTPKARTTHRRTLPRGTTRTTITRTSRR